MSVKLFADDGILWNIRALDISGNYGQRLTLGSDGSFNFFTGSSSKISIDGSGNFNFLETGQRFRADFSNATASNRLLFQTSTVNNNTVVGIVPNGTGLRTSQIALYNTQDTLSAGVLVLNSNASSVQITSSTTSGGTGLPIQINNGANIAQTISTAGITDFSGNIPTYNATPTTSTQIVNKNYVDGKFSLNTIGVSSIATGQSDAAWTNLHNMGTLAAGTYFVSCQGRWEYSLGSAAVGQVRVYDNTGGTNLLIYPQITTLIPGYTYQSIGLSGIFTIASASNVIIQSFCDYVPGAVQVWVSTSYWRIS